MKHLIVLPGNSLENRTWGEMMAEHYAPYVDTADMVSYDHWESGDPMIDFEVELQKLQTKYTTSADEVFIIAKSSGVILALMAIAEKVWEPVHVVAFGIPFDMAEQYQLLGCAMVRLVHVDTPMTVYHNSNDPVADCRYTEAVLRQHLPQAVLCKTEGTDHWYGDLDRYDVEVVPLLTGEG